MRCHKPLQIRRVFRGYSYMREVPAYGYLTRNEVADVLGVSLRWVYRLIELRRLPVIRRRGRALIAAQAVLSFKQKNKGGERHAH